MEGQGAFQGEEEFVGVDSDDVDGSDPKYQIKVLESPEVRCNDVENLFGEYVDGDLPLTLKGRLDEHISSCPGCREFSRTYLKTIQLANQIAEHPMPRGARERLRTKLNSKLGLKLPVQERGEA